MLDHELINRTLSTAMSTGGEFAEVFVEDKRSSSAVFDDGRVEELTSGRDRGAGIRVVDRRGQFAAGSGTQHRQGPVFAPTARNARAVVQERGQVHRPLGFRAQQQQAPGRAGNRRGASWCGSRRHAETGTAAAAFTSSVTAR